MLIRFPSVELLSWAWRSPIYLNAAQDVAVAENGLSVQVKARIGFAPGAVREVVEIEVGDVVSG
jgi:hypothetical protein